MPMRSTVFSFFLCLSFPSFALETDNYLTWDKNLRDSSVQINRFFTESIEYALLNIPDHQSKSCEEMTALIGKDFESHLVHDNPVENWLFRILTDEEMFPAGLHYIDESIYRDPYRFYIPWFGLAPNIQVNGYYFGTDKLSHFASTGRIYFRIYQKELRNKLTPENALKKAIDWGIKDEKTVHGYWASGVFSYSDLEANYQGFRFYQDFCNGRNSFLRQSEDGNWKLINKPEIKKYVNAYWDETFELPYRLPENWKKVSHVIKEKYCSLANSGLVRKRFRYYQSSGSTGFSKEYLAQRRDLPSPSQTQSFTNICSEDGIEEVILLN